MKNSNKFTITPVTPFLVLLVFALTIALFMRGGEVLTALSVSTTNSSAATVNITNSAPTCGAMTCYDTDDAADYIKPVGGGQRYAKCNATCNDENGWGNIQNYTGQMYNAGSGNCPAAYNTNCYLNATCQNTTIAGNDTGQYVTCSYLFWYNADNTSQTGDWTGRIKAGDIPGTEATATDTIDVQALLAIGVDSTLSFGSKSAGTNDTTLLKLHNLYNYGNVQMDFQVNGSAMTCGVGTITAEYLKVSLTAGDTFVSGYPLTATLSGPASSKFGLYNLDENVTTTTQPPMAPNKSTFWGVGIPPARSGNCQGTIWFAAVLS